MSESINQDDGADEARTRLRDGIERTRELCADAKRRLRELASPHGSPGPEHLAQ